MEQLICALDALLTEAESYIYKCRKQLRAASVPLKTYHNLYAWGVKYSTDKMKLLVRRYTTDLHETPYTAEVILETGAKINIDRANVDAVRADLIIDIPSDKLEQVAEHFRQKGLEVRRLAKLIAWDEERCIPCGACISVCPAHVFTFDQAWTIHLEEGKCIRCEVCIKACPLNALASVD